jgi:hypothetical protein
MTSVFFNFLKIFLNGDGQAYVVQIRNQQQQRPCLTIPKLFHALSENRPYARTFVALNKANKGQLPYRKCPFAAHEDGFSTRDAALIFLQARAKSTGFSRIRCNS